MVYLIIVLAVLARFLPHAWNFSPVYGALLFGGARLNKRESIWCPALLLAISDFILTDFVYHLHLGWKVIFQVAAFASISFAGWLLRERISATLASGRPGIRIPRHGRAWRNATSQPFRFSGAHLAAQLFFQQFSSELTNTGDVRTWLKHAADTGELKVLLGDNYENLFVSAVRN